MARAQGIARTQWFEGRDPVGEDQVLAYSPATANRVPHTRHWKLLASAFGPNPKYVGWLTLGNPGCYGFMFEGKDGPVLAAWMSAKAKGKRTEFRNTELTITNLVTGEKMKQKELN